MPLQERAYLDIQKMIDNGELKLGVVYSETKLSQLLDISRTPLRSALNRMVQDGYIDILPSRGFVLHEMTDSEFMDYVDMICAIESFAAISCMQSGKKRNKTIKQLEQIQSRIASAKPEELPALNNEFHTILIQMNGNLVLSRHYHNILHLMRTQHVVKCFGEDDLQKMVNDHEALLNAMKDDNATLLLHLIHEHLRGELVAQ